MSEGQNDHEVVFIIHHRGSDVKEQGSGGSPPEVGFIFKK